MQMQPERQILTSLVYHPSYTHLETELKLAKMNNNIISFPMGRPRFFPVYRFPHLLSLKRFLDLFSA